MSRIETIEGELKEAMKAREAERRDALRLILNALKNSEKELQRPLSFHGSAGWSIGRRNSWPPMRSISWRTIASTLRATRSASGSFE